MPVRSFICNCRQPVYAEMLRPRVVALSIAAMGAAQVVASCVGFGFPCPFHALTGMPCPGCGLTRSVLALAHGNFSQSFFLHPLGPPLFLAIALAVLAAILPGRARDVLIRGIGFVEAKTGLAFIGVTLLFVIWGARITGLVHLARV